MTDTVTCTFWRNTAENLGINFNKGYFVCIHLLERQELKTFANILRCSFLSFSLILLCGRTLFGISVQVESYKPFSFQPLPVWSFWSVISFWMDIQVSNLFPVLGYCMETWLFCRDFWELESQPESMLLLLSWKGFKDQCTIITENGPKIITRMVVPESIHNFWQIIADFLDRRFQLSQNCSLPSFSNHLQRNSKVKVLSSLDLDVRTPNSPTSLGLCW